ncbi:hypothetical protein BDW72DRAFT_168620 [Aspergillus terricola var. indicus]
MQETVTTPFIGRIVTGAAHVPETASACGIINSAANRTASSPPILLSVLLNILTSFPSYFSLLSFLFA